MKVEPHQNNHTPTRSDIRHKILFSDIICNAERSIWAFFRRRRIFMKIRPELFPIQPICGLYLLHKYLCDNSLRFGCTECAFFRSEAKRRKCVESKKSRRKQPRKMN